MSDFEDHELIGTLRSSGHREPADVATPLSETIRRGRTARWRRNLATAAGDGLPDGMSGGVSLMTFPAGEPLHSGWCDRLEEKRTTVTACSDHTVGQAIVKTQEGSRTAGGKGGAWESIRTTYKQPDGDAVVLDLYAWEDDRSTTPDRQEAARAWLESTHEQIVHVVVNPAIQPPARVHPDYDSDEAQRYDAILTWLDDQADDLARAARTGDR